MTEADLLAPDCLLWPLAGKTLFQSRPLLSSPRTRNDLPLPFYLSKSPLYWLDLYLWLDPAPGSASSKNSSKIAPTCQPLTSLSASQPESVLLK